jgi:uncharacterized repeat protein (TIGR03803 family)
MIYGTAHGGSQEGGVVFTLGKDGTGYRILYGFAGTGGGSRFPRGLLESQDGVLYGVTRFGGTTTANNTQGFGTVFKLSKDGSDYSVLHAFDSTLGYAEALTEGLDGAFYGATLVGPGDTGAIFKLNRDGSGYQVLHRFGASAPSRLIQTRDGTLYGTSTADWDIPGGYVFKMNPDGSGFANLYAFQLKNGDGSQFSSGLVKGRDGAFYGASNNGGELGYGTLFRILPPETPELIGVVLSEQSAQINLAGVAGKNYRLFRSNDLSQWSLLDTMTMPSSGVFTVAEPLQANPREFYRASWVPDQ